ncbi:MAG: hypothetical protein EA355_00115, partial [Rhodobacteraceae bacterium]
MALRAAGQPVTIQRETVGVGAAKGESARREAEGALRFGPFELDFDRYELRRAGARVALEPRTFDLLALLARRRGRTVTRDEIFDALWPGRFVSDAALSSQIRSARKALGDDGTRQAYIATVHGRGFRLRRSPLDLEPPAAESAAAGEPGRGEDPCPCVAVLPCSTPGDDARGAVIGEGLTEDLINALARHRWLRVVTRNSAFALGRSGEPLDSILDRLGADY